MKGRGLASWSVSLAAFAFGCEENRNVDVAHLFTDYQGPDSPGAVVMVIRDGEPVLTESYGLANVEERVPVTSRTNFRLASVTKQFTAMAVLMLVERGELDLDDSLLDVFPDFPPFAADITVRHLLQHTSGLLDYESLMAEDATAQVLDADVLAMMKATEGTYFPPGTEYRYSNSGYAVLAMVVERVSGQSFARFLEENIFRPLGMDRSVAYEKGVSTVENRAYGYTVGEDGVRFSDQSPTSAVLGDGGVYSSVEDLLKWDRALGSGELIHANLLRQAWTPGPGDYGFGWWIDRYRGRRRVHHYGSTSGFRNFLQRFPDDGLTVVVLTNRAEPDVRPLGEKVADLFLEYN